jgi:hypothetical protein
LGELHVLSRTGYGYTAVWALDFGNRATHACKESSQDERVQTPKL